MKLPAVLVIGVGASRCLPCATIVHIYLILIVSYDRIPIGELPSRGGPTGRDQFSEKGELCWRQAKSKKPAAGGRAGAAKTLSPFKGNRTGNSVSDLR